MSHQTPKTSDSICKYLCGWCEIELKVEGGCSSDEGCVGDSVDVMVMGGCVGEGGYWVM